MHWGCLYTHRDDKLSPANSQMPHRVPRPGAFQPVAPNLIPLNAAPTQAQIQERQKRRDQRKQKRDPPINAEAGPVDFSQYPPTAKLWLEQVDTKTVQKSKTMYLTAMPEGFKPPPELENVAPSYVHTADDVFLPPQWVIARGRSLRRRKQRLDEQRQSQRHSSNVTSGESDVEGADRPLSPGKQMLLFFRYYI